jgi:hypothetical protein
MLQRIQIIFSDQTELHLPQKSLTFAHAFLYILLGGVMRSVAEDEDFCLKTFSFAPGSLSLSAVLVQRDPEYFFLFLTHYSPHLKSAVRVNECKLREPIKRVAVT